MGQLRQLMITRPDPRFEEALRRPCTAKGAELVYCTSNEEMGD